MVNIHLGSKESLEPRSYHHYLPRFRSIFRLVSELFQKKKTTPPAFSPSSQSSLMGCRAPAYRQIAHFLLRVNHRKKGRKKNTPQKFNKDIKKGHTWKEPPFPNHHFGYPMLVFRGSCPVWLRCKPSGKISLPVDAENSASSILFHLVRFVDIFFFRYGYNYFLMRILIRKSNHQNQDLAKS